MYLLSLLQVLSSLVSMVVQCSVVSVPAGTGRREQVMTAAVVPVEHLFDLKEVFKVLNSLLPSSHIPDRIVCLPSIPVNRHGTF